MLLLYREIHIDSMEQAIGLARRGTRQYLKKTFEISVSLKKWVTELMVILRACGGLKVLKLNHPLRQVPVDFLRFPSLRSMLKSFVHRVSYCTDWICCISLDLQSLTLFCKFTTISPRSLSSATPNHLKSLSAIVTTDSVPLFVSLTTSLETSGSLNTLDVHIGYDHLPIFLPLASSITTLSLGYQTLDHLRDFFVKAVMLSHLELSCLGRYEFGLRGVLDALNSRLKTVALPLSNIQGFYEAYNEEIILILTDATGLSTSILGGLGKIEFMDIGGTKLREIGGWEELSKNFLRNGTRVFTKFEGTLEEVEEGKGNS